MGLHWAPMPYGFKPIPPRSKAQERDANGHSNSSNPVKVDPSIPGSYSKQIKIPYR